MGSVDRLAGAAGSIGITTKTTAGQLIPPVSPPVVRWYTDAARTLGEVTLTVTGAGSSYTASWTAAQAPPDAAARYLRVTIEVSAGVFDVDADDEVRFLDAVSAIDSSTRFASAGELAAMLQRTFSAAEITAAEWALDNATAAIKNYARQRIEAVANEAVVLRGNWSDSLWLPERPVTAVASVKVGTAPVLSASAYTWSRHGLLHASSGWGGPHDVVAVTYSHGFAVIPDDVKAVCLAAASRSFTNLDGIRSETIGSYAVTYNTPATGEGVLLSRSEKEMLRRYRPLVPA